MTRIMKTPKQSHYSPVKREVISAHEFVRLTRERPAIIARSRFVVPTIGGRDFGGFEVEYTVPKVRQVSALA